MVEIFLDTFQDSERNAVQAHICLETIFVFLFCRMDFFFFFFLAALGLRCCTWGFSSCGERGLLFVAVCSLLIMVASLTAEHGL